LLAWLTKLAEHGRLDFLFIAATLARMLAKSRPRTVACH
jgi:hypothetical protein